MKKFTIFFYVLFLFFITGILYAQSGWVALNPNTTVTLTGVAFKNAYTGVVVGDSGKVRYTSNAGNTLIPISIPATNYLYFVTFPSSDTGYLGGYANTFYKTTNGGLNWFSIPVPVSSSLNIVSCHFLNGNTGYLLCSNDTICRTTDGGSTFTKLYTGLPSANPKSDIKFFNYNTGYVIGFQMNYYLRTINSGASWTSLTLPVGFPNRMYIYNSNTCYITCGTSILKSTNAGLNYTLINLGVNTAVDIAFINNNTGFTVGASGSIYKSTNSGINWAPDDTSGTSKTLSRIFYSGYHLYVTGANGTLLRKKILRANLNSIYKPNVGWNMYEPITLYDSLCSGPIDSIIWYVNDSLVGRQNSLTYNYKQGTSIVKLIVKNNSSQGIDTAVARITRIAWKKYTNGQIRAGLSMIGDSILYAISTGDAVYRMDINGNILYPLTVQGNVLSSCSIGYDTTVFIASDANYLYGFNKNGGPLWSQIALGGSASATPTIDSTSNRLYIGVSNGNFQAFNKINGSYEWSMFLNSQIKSSAVVSYNRKLVVASAVGTVYGFNLNNPTPVPPNWQLSLSDSILVSPAIDTNGYFYFGSRSGKVYKISLTGTTNIGIVWQTPLPSAVTSSPTLDANGNIYVGTADGKFYSLNKNGGIRWFFQSPAAIKSTAAITTYQRIYFGNDAGEIYGLDTNKIVKFYYIDSAKISCAMLHYKGTLYFGNEAGRIFALYDSTGGTKGPVKPIWGTFQNNVRRTGSQRDGGQSIGVQKINDYIPDKYELYQNYPNPFNPVTNIKYSIPSNVKGEKLNVRLIIYDILGRVVATLVNQKQSPGEYSVDFDGTNFTSGVYFYKIETVVFSGIKKMILLK